MVIEGVNIKKFWFHMVIEGVNIKKFWFHTCLCSKFIALHHYNADRRVDLLGYGPTHPAGFE